MKREDEGTLLMISAAFSSGVGSASSASFSGAMSRLQAQRSVRLVSIPPPHYTLLSTTLSPPQPPNPILYSREAYERALEVSNSLVFGEMRRRRRTHASTDERATMGRAAAARTERRARREAILVERVVREREDARPRSSASRWGRGLSEQPTGRGRITPGSVAVFHVAGGRS